MILIISKAFYRDLKCKSLVPNWPSYGDKDSFLGHTEVWIPSNLKEHNERAQTILF